jgi:hypothetical protein
MSWRILLAILAVATLAFAAGWYARERAAIADCDEAGGEWAPRSGHCMGALFGEIEV